MPSSPIFKIAKTDLKKYYLKDKMSMVNIAQLFGCSHATIVNRMKAYGIKSRGNLGLRRALNITREGLERQYRRGLSLAKIANIFHCSEGAIERRFKKLGLTSRGINKRASKYKKCDFSENTLEKAYMIGFRLGDLNIYNLKNIIQIRCSTTHQAQINLIRNLFSSYTHPHVWKAKRGTYEIVCLVNKSFSFLVPKHNSIPNWILNNENSFLSFFAGYSDAEGCFYFRKPKKTSKIWSASFEIQTQQKEIIFALWDNMRHYGIESQSPKISRRAGSIQKSYNLRNNKDMWRFSVDTKRSLWKLIHSLKPYLKHKEKLTKIEKIKENILSRNQIKWGRKIDLSIPAV